MYEVMVMVEVEQQRGRDRSVRTRETFSSHSWPAINKKLKSLIKSSEKNSDTIDTEKKLFKK